MKHSENSQVNIAFIQKKKKRQAINEIDWRFSVAAKEILSCSLLHSEPGNMAFIALLPMNFKSLQSSNFTEASHCMLKSDDHFGWQMPSIFQKTSMF